MGLLSAQLTATVCKISAGNNRPGSAQLAFALDRINQTLIPELKSLFQKDAEDFDKVIQARQARNEATDPVLERRLATRSLRLLETSTDLVFSIAQICLQLVDYGSVAFDSGARKVRGDSGAAISVAIAGAMSAVFIINLNLRSFKGSKWALDRQRRSDALYADIIRRQEDAFSRIVTLQPETVADLQRSFFE